MTVMTTAGSTFKISAGVPATFDSTGFGALTYTLVGEVTDMGEVGRKYNIVNHNPISNRRTQKIKGSYDPGTISLKFARDYSDNGQVMLTTAAASDSPYAVMITLQNGKKLYFTGLVASFTTSVGTVDQITAASCDITLQTDVLEV